MDGLLTLGTSPSPLANVESAANRPGIRFSRFRIDDALFRLDNCARLALVVDTEDFAPELEPAALASHGQRLQEFHLALPVKRRLGIEFWNALDWRGIAACIEINDVLVGVLEWKDGCVGRESSEVGMEFLRHKNQHHGCCDIQSIHSSWSFMCRRRLRTVPLT